jgi:hypothetical protein
MSEQMSTGAMANEIRRAIIADRSDQWFATLILADRKATVEKCKAKVDEYWESKYYPEYLEPEGMKTLLDAIVEEESK